MAKQAQCPVCGAKLGDKIPDFCPSCGWECGTDITLIPTLSKPTEVELEYRQRKLDLAQEHWTKMGQLTKLTSDCQKDLSQAKLTLEEKLEEINNLREELEVARQQSTEEKPKPSDPESPLLDLVYVEGGLFRMGSNQYNNEKPIHTVALSSFNIGKYLVTQDLRQFVENYDPSRSESGSRLPANASWEDAVKFCNLLSLREGLQSCYSLFGATDPVHWDLIRLRKLKCDFRASGYRLPTEAEWEYAARGGNRSRSYAYSGGNDLNRVAWYKENSDGKTHPVGEKKANELGIYDMSGNVWEWCWDWYAGGYNAKSPAQNPTGPRRGTHRVLRGGSWTSYDYSCRVAYRGSGNPDCRDYSYGFRVARAVF